MYLGRVAAVSYLNTVPFIYGIEHAHSLRADLLLSPPSANVEAFVNGLADIALVPSAAVPLLTDAHIVTRYCLGAHNPVRSVVILSNSPITNTKRLYLDSHSRTSVLLSKILCDELWHIQPDFVHMNGYSAVDTPAGDDAFLLIGDKVFDYENRFAYKYDLAEAWENMTSLPFVFAVWIARHNIPDTHIAALEEALAYGVAHIPESIAWYGHSGKPYSLDYLTNNIDFIFDEQKHKALSLYWEKGMKFSPQINPG